MNMGDIVIVKNAGIKVDIGSFYQEFDNGDKLIITLNGGLIAKKDKHHVEISDEKTKDAYIKFVKGVTKTV